MNRRTLEQPNSRTLFREGCLPSTRSLAAYYFWYFAAIGVYEPYLTPFWLHLGFSPAQLGLLNAIYPAVTAVVAVAGTALYWAGTREPASTKRALVAS